MKCSGHGPFVREQKGHVHCTSWFRPWRNITRTVAFMVCFLSEGPCPVYMVVSFTNEYYTYGVHDGFVREGRSHVHCTSWFRSWRNMTRAVTFMVSSLSEVPCPLYMVVLSMEEYYTYSVLHGIVRGRKGHVRLFCYSHRQLIRYQTGLFDRKIRAERETRIEGCRRR
jgi:hypothetical protein